MASELSWSGDVDLLSVPTLEPALQDALARSTGGVVVLDLSRVSFIDSTGLRVLVRARTASLAHDTRLVLRSTSPPVRRLLTVTGLAPHFEFDDSYPISEVDVAALPRSFPRFNDEPPAADPLFDRVASLISRLVDAPTALVSFVSQSGQVAPGAVGLSEPFQRTRTMELSLSTCQFVVDRSAPVVTSDMRTDPFHGTNDPVTRLGIVAYAGFPITGPTGRPVGSVCAADTKPRKWTETELATLSDLAAICSHHVRLRIALYKAAKSEEPHTPGGVLASRDPWNHVAVPKG